MHKPLYIFIIFGMEGSPYAKPSRVKIVEEHGRAYLVVSRKKAKTITTHTST
jgi:hypothetical protein